MHGEPPLENPLLPKPSLFEFLLMLSGICFGIFCLTIIVANILTDWSPIVMSLVWSTILVGCPSFLIGILGFLEQ